MSRRRHKNPSQFDGRVPKFTPLRRKHEGKRVSIKVPKIDNYGDHCSEHDWYSARGKRQPLPPGSKQLYSPEQVYNYKSQWARYQRALSIKPSAIIEENRCTKYLYPSCDSPTGYWEVKVCSGGATFIELGPPLTIMCPVPYLFTQGETDAEAVVWEQLSGDRSLTIDPDNTIDPTFYLENFCVPGTGCSDESELPIVLKASVAGQPELYDFLTIYTTPTSTHYGNSFAVTQRAADPCFKVQNIYPAPLYINRGYCNEGEAISITWNPPECDEDLVGYIWQKNTTGEYVTVDQFATGDDLTLELELNTHYRVVSVFRTHSRTYQSVSQTFYIPYLPGTGNTPHRAFADDTHRGVSFAVSKIEISTNVPTVKRVLVESKNRGISFAVSGSAGRKINLGVKRISATSEHRGIGFAPGEQRITKYQLGGILIG